MELQSFELKNVLVEGFLPGMNLVFEVYEFYDDAERERKGDEKGKGDKVVRAAGAIRGRNHRWPQMVVNKYPAIRSWGVHEFEGRVRHPPERSLAQIEPRSNRWLPRPHGAGEVARHPGQ